MRDTADNKAEGLRLSLISLYTLKSLAACLTSLRICYTKKSRALAPVHHAGGVAYRIEADGKSVTYSGDTAPDDNLIKLAKETDTLVHECSFPSEEFLLGLHTTATELGHLAAKAECKRLVLTHLYPVCETRTAEMVSSVSRAQDYCGEIIARAYMELTV